MYKKLYLLSLIYNRGLNFLPAAAGSDAGLENL